MVLIDVDENGGGGGECGREIQNNRSLYTGVLQTGYGM